MPDLPRTPDAPRLRRTWPQRVLITFNVLVIVSFVAAAAGLGYVYQKFGQLPRLDLDTSLTSDSDASGEPQNFLIVGVDSASGLDPDDPVRAQRGRVGGLRSDTVMVLRVDPEAKEAALLSLPRDLWVPISGTSGNQRINTAINAGPDRLIATIQDYFHIPIHHYVQVDFAGFIELVDAVDGVPVPFAYPVRDVKSGLAVPDAGCVTLRSGQALAYVRSRELQTYRNGRWRYDPTADLGRISRQQDFIERALQRAVAAGVRNPSKLDSLIDAGLGAVTVDTGLRGRDVFDLGRQLRSFDPDHLKMFRVPVVNDRVGGASIVRMVDAEAQPILDRFRGVDPSDVSPETTRVRVLNGSGEPNQASMVSAALTEQGFGVTPPGDYERSRLPQTLVLYPPGAEAAAGLVASYLSGPASLVEDEEVEGGDVILVTGLDFLGVRDTPAATTSTSSTTTTEPSTTSTSEPEPSSTTTSTSTPTIGTVPVDGENGVSC